MLKELWVYMEKCIEAIFAHIIAIGTEIHFSESCEPNVIEH